MTHEKANPFCAFSDYEHCPLLHELVCGGSQDRRVVEYAIVPNEVRRQVRSEDGAVAVLGAKTGILVDESYPDDGEIGSIVFSQDGRVRVTAQEKATAVCGAA